MPSTLISINCDVAILDRIIKPEQGNLPITAARAILKWDFEQSDHDRLHYLSEKARIGNLSAEEQAEIHEYERVGHLLDVMQSKARKSLKKQSNGN